MKRLISSILLSLALLSCSPRGIAQENYTPRDNWDYAANVLPNSLMEQVTQEVVPEDWVGDPRRFAVIKVQQRGQRSPIYLINPSLTRLDGCPPAGCPSDLSQLSPLCGEVVCQYFVYIEKNGQYREIFGSSIPKYLPPEYPFFRVSRELTNGLPCLEFAYLPERQDPEAVAVSRFCYEGQKYVAESEYFEPLPENR